MPTRLVADFIIFRSFALALELSRDGIINPSKDVIVPSKVLYAFASDFLSWLLFVEYLSVEGYDIRNVLLRYELASHVLVIFSMAPLRTDLKATTSLLSYGEIDICA
jgi:hypothetical protein